MQNNLQRLRSWIDQFSAPGVGMFLYLVSLSFYWSNLSFLIFTIPYISTLIPLSSLTRSRDSSRVVEINLSLVSILLLTFLLLYGLSVFFSSDPNNSLQYSSAWPAAQAWAICATVFAPVSGTPWLKNWSASRAPPIPTLSITTRKARGISRSFRGSTAANRWVAYR